MEKYPNKPITVCAGIVLYEPSIERLLENYNAISKQVDLVILVDNGSTNIDMVQQQIVAQQTGNMHWILNTKNIGVAGALNQIIDYAHDLDYDWVVTLDQDSVCCEHMIDKYKEAACVLTKAAILSPYVIDVNWFSYEQYKNLKMEPYERMERVITSGGFTNVAVAKSISGFCTKLFIDEVDHDFCMRLKKNGYEVWQVSDAYIFHSIGKVKTYYLFPRLAKLTHNQWLLRPKRTTYHAPIRIYYQARNHVYTMRKYGDIYDNKKQIEILFWKTIVFKLLMERQRFQKLIAFIRGLIDGLFMNIDED